MNLVKKALFFALLAVLSGASGSNSNGARAQSHEEAGDAARASAAAKRLASRDPLIRQRAAEELADMSATTERRLLEGYRLQEKNSRVKLALDWALYRTGKDTALFAVVRDLDSSRFDQAHAYLIRLDAPDPLYLFLERVNGNTQVKLLEVMAKIGDAGTLDRIKPFTESPDPKIAEAARLATREIEQRLGQTPVDTLTRPRQVGQSEASP
jgi:hypothetical protein